MTEETRAKNQLITPKVSQTRSIILRRTIAFLGWINILAKEVKSEFFPCSKILLTARDFSLMKGDVSSKAPFTFRSTSLSLRALNEKNRNDNTSNRAITMVFIVYWATYSLTSLTLICSTWGYLKIANCASTIDDWKNKRSKYLRTIWLKRE